MLKRPGGEKMAMNDVECCEENCIHAELLKKAREKMPDEDELYDLAELFKVFGDSTRIRILFVLFGSEVCVLSLIHIFFNEFYRRGIYS